MMKLILYTFLIAVAVVAMGFKSGLIKLEDPKRARYDRSVWHVDD